MATPLKKGYYFELPSSKSPQGLRRSGQDWSKVRRRRYWFLSRRHLYRGPNMWHPTLGYWCAWGVVVIVRVRLPRGILASRNPGSSPRNLRAKELHLIYWNFCTFPGMQKERKREIERGKGESSNATAATAGVSFYARFGVSRSPDNSPARLRSSRKSTLLR